MAKAVVSKNLKEDKTVKEKDIDGKFKPTDADVNKVVILPVLLYSTDLH